MTTQSPSMASQATAEFPKLPEPTMLALIEEHLGLVSRRDRTVVNNATGRWTDSARYFDLIGAAIACYEAGRASRAQSEWQPIETAPKDGSPILVWMPEPILNSNIHAATYHPNVACIGGVFAFDAPSQPTHWMPQRAAPATSGETK